MLLWCGSGNFLCVFPVIIKGKQLITESLQYQNSRKKEKKREKKRKKEKKREKKRKKEKKREKKRKKEKKRHDYYEQIQVLAFTLAQKYLFSFIKMILVWYQFVHASIVKMLFSECQDMNVNVSKWYSVSVSILIRRGCDKLIAKIRC